MVEVKFVFGKLSQFYKKNGFWSILITIDPVLIYEPTRPDLKAKRQLSLGDILHGRVQRANTQIYSNGILFYSILF